MENFVYYNPVRILFGEGKIAEIGHYVPKGMKVMMTYGGGSIKKNGVYDQVMKALTGTDVVELRAESDCGLPVRYYVKEGPAEVESGHRLRLTRIPPRAQFPVKVTVVAWQYGLPGKVQTDEPVERSFYIVKG